MVALTDNKNITMKINNKYKLTLSAIMILSIQNSLGEELQNKAQAIENLGIYRNFKDFSVSLDEEKPNQYQILYSSVNKKKNRLIGFEIILSNQNYVQELKPIMVHGVENFELITWAFNAFREEKLTINSLWEILKAGLPDETKNFDILTMLIHQIAGSNGKVNLNTIQLPVSGLFRDAVDAEFRNREIKMDCKTLDCVRHRLDL